MDWMTSRTPAPSPAPGPTFPTDTPGVTGPALVDLAAAGGVDLDRLERALALHADRVGPGRWRVSGGAGDHWVDLHHPAHPRCDCGDHVWREQVCKHILAALLREGDGRVVAAVAELTAVLRARLVQAAEALRAARPAPTRRRRPAADATVDAAPPARHAA